MIVILSFLLLLLFSIFRTNSKYTSLFFSAFIVISLICAAGFRDGGYDYINYVNGYNWNSFREPFFRLLVSLLHSISATYRLFFIIIAIIISIIAQATNTNLVSNTTFILLLLLALGAYNQNGTSNSSCGCGCSNNGCSCNQQRSFI